MAVALGFLLRWFRRMQQHHAQQHGALTEQLLATEQQRMELEMEGGPPLSFVLSLFVPPSGLPSLSVPPLAGTPLGLLLLSLTSQRQS